MLRKSLRRLVMFQKALRDGDRLGSILLVLIALHGAAVVTMGTTPAAARWFMQRFHLATGSFAGWSSYVVGPWMYNFENQVLVSPHALSAKEREQPSPAVAWWYINHQSARVVTFGDHRPAMLREPGVRFVYLRSRYRDTVVTTGLRLRVFDASRPYRAELERLEEP